MAHICGKQPGSNRYDASQAEEERDDYQNLILLCPNHHTLIDKKENEAIHTKEILVAMKRRHESVVESLLETGMENTRRNVAREVLIFLEENRQAWMKYGPLSALAKSNPHSDEIHSIWLDEKLATIVPNNRRIASILADKRRVFDDQEQKAISSFILHARSYERWVRDEIPYDGVVPFPAEFDNLIRKSVGAGI